MLETPGYHEVIACERCCDGQSQAQRRGCGLGTRGVRGNAGFRVGLVRERWRVPIRCTYALNFIIGASKLGDAWRTDRPRGRFLLSIVHGAKPRLSIHVVWPAGGAGPPPARPCPVRRPPLACAGSVLCEVTASGPHLPTASTSAPHGHIQPFTPAPHGRVRHHRTSQPRVSVPCGVHHG